MKKDEQILSELLDELSQRLQSISMAIDETIWDHDIINNTIRYNDRITSVFGYTVEEVNGAVSWWYNNLHPEDVKPVKDSLANALDNGLNRVEMRYRYRCADGSYKPVYDRATILRDSDGTPSRMIGVMQDMTPIIDIERARNRLRDTALKIATDEEIMSGRHKNKSLNKTLLEATLALRADWGGIWILQENGLTCEACVYQDKTIPPNERPQPISGIFMDLLDGESSSIIHDTQSTDVNLFAADTYFKPANIRSAMLQLIRIKGSPRAILGFESVENPRHWSDDEIQFTATIADQISQILTNAEILQKELELEQSLLEKETLLQEIHHRVKNNLAVVSSLMQLQAMETSNDEVREQLLDSTTRIRSMALIHEELYRNDNFNYLDIEQTIRGLVDYASSIMQGSNRVDVRYTLQPIRVNINQAVPLSLIVNEVVTNAYKHAFKAGIDAPCVCINTTLDNKLFCLAITDNGVGFPDDFDFDAINSLGMQLLHTLTEQLMGSYSIGNDAKGTTFKLEFELQDVKGAHSSL
ncbi:MAG: PAS domain-containing protein [Bacteroidetes bacterium]|nr:PAS domain-containing protein [Bacteroidota bacterium]MCH8524516.1 PAS domain-containing protein [Balneolales bacterium]